MKYKSELAKINQPEEKMTPKLKQYVNSINELLETKAEITRRLEAKEGDREELQADLAECEADINNLDNELCEKIIAWDVQIQRLANARASKKPIEPKKPVEKKTAAPVAKSAPVATPAPTPAAPAKAAAPAPSPAPVAPVVTAEPEKKKGNGFGWVMFGVLALVVTVGAVNLLKKD